MFCPNSDIIYGQKLQLLNKKILLPVNDAAMHLQLVKGKLFFFFLLVALYGPYTERAPKSLAFLWAPASQIN